MTLIDTSAWVEYLRDTGSTVCEQVDHLLAEDASIAGTDVVFMEVLAGARSPARAKDLERLLNRATHLPARPLFDYEEAARLYRTCREGGFTPRRMTDCLIAAVALHHGAAVLHHDRDFDGIAEHTGLLIAAEDQSG